MLHLLHFQGFGVGAGSGLFAQHIFPGSQGVYGNLGVNIVGGADGNSLHLWVRENLVVINHRRAAAIFLHSGLGPFWNDVAEIFDLRLRIFYIRRNMGGVGDGAASNNRYFHVQYTPLTDSGRKSLFCDYSLYFSFCKGNFPDHQSFFTFPPSLRFTENHAILNPSKESSQIRKDPRPRAFTASRRGLARDCCPRLPVWGQV